MSDEEIKQQEVSAPPPTMMVEAVRHNDITFVSEANHKDDDVHKDLIDRLHGMHDVGAKAVYMEFDPKDTSKQEILAQTDAYGVIAKEADKLGMDIRFYDDRSHQRERDAKYPEAAKYVADHDFHLEHIDETVKNSPNPAQTRAYIDDILKNADKDLNFRNERMIENLDAEFQKHPNEKAIVLVGGAHLNKEHDVDEGLREKGHQSTTVTTAMKDSYIPADNIGKDDPDLIKADGALVYKDHATSKMKYAKSLDEVPWKNNEPVNETPVSEKPHPFANLVKQANVQGCEGVKCTGDKQIAPVQTPNMPVQERTQQMHK